MGWFSKKRSESVPDPGSAPAGKPLWLVRSFPLPPRFAPGPGNTPPPNWTAQSLFACVPAPPPRLPPPRPVLPGWPTSTTGCFQAPAPLAIPCVPWRAPPGHARSSTSRPTAAPPPCGNNGRPGPSPHWPKPSLPPGANGPRCPASAAPPSVGKPTARSQSHIITPLREAPTMQPGCVGTFSLRSGSNKSPSTAAKLP